MSIYETDTIASVNEIDKQEIESNNKLPGVEKRSHKQGRFFYTVGLFNFLLEEDIKAENLYDHKANPVPHTPEWCSGIVNVRGNIIPIVDMNILLKTGNKNSDSRKNLLLIEHKSHPPIIFQIDSLPEISFLDEYTLKKLPKKHPSWLIKHFKNENNSLYEIDHSDLLNTLKNN